MMTREDYIATLRWFTANRAQFVQSSRDGQWAATWFLQDGSCFELPTIEACESFEAVQALVCGKVATPA